MATRTVVIFWGAVKGATGEIRDGGHTDLLT